ncbi:hypothetical protein BDK51DRAFT_6862, partial [Blyttiomyces helicus]
KDLAGKVALVTGASRGITKACAAELASRGADVIVTYCSDKSHAEAAAAHSHDLTLLSFQLGVRSLYVQSDSGSDDAGKQLLDEIKRKFGKIDIIVNKAGAFGQSVRIESEYDRTFSVYTKGVFFLVTSALDLGLLQDHGRIINITSVAARLGGPTSGVYGASKAAL